MKGLLIISIIYHKVNKRIVEWSCRVLHNASILDNFQHIYG